MARLTLLAVVLLCGCQMTVRPTLDRYSGLRVSFSMAPEDRGSGRPDHANARSEIEEDGETAAD